MKDTDYLSNHSSHSASLLNSRMRMYCEASEHQSELDEQQNQNALRQFETQIEDRFKLSIANKIYTFPKFITSIRDFISSDEEDFQDSHSQEKKKLFKKKSIKNQNYIPHHNLLQKKQKEKHFQNESSLKNKDTSLSMLDHSHNKNVQSKKKSQRKQDKEINPTTKFNPFHQYDRKQKHIVNKYELKASQKNKSKDKKKIHRLKTEPESASSFIDTIRTKIGKKN